MSKKLTPMMQQYWTAKNSLGKGYLLLFRLGDFYELFYDDALISSKLLGITLTKRNDIPMCGVPAHAVDNYIKKLLAQGKKVAICEQTSPVQKGNLVTREIIETITPGTISDVVYLDSTKHNFLVAVTILENSLICAWIDVSTIELFVEVTDTTPDTIKEHLRTILGKIQVKELLYPESLEETLYIKVLSHEFSVHTTPMRDWDFSISEGERTLRELFGVNTLKAFDLHSTSRELASVNALLQYVESLGTGILGKLDTIKIVHTQDYLEMDADAIYNLEIFSSIRNQDTNHSLIGVLDICATAMGSRCLSQWMSYPLTQKQKIETRQQYIHTLIEENNIKSDIEVELSTITDIMRIMTRVMMNKAHAKDIIAVKQSVKHVLNIHSIIHTASSQFISQFSHFFPPSMLERFRQLYELIQRALVDDPPVSFGERYIVQSSYNDTLSQLRTTHENQKDILDSYVAKEQENLSIQLRLKYNNIIGYFFDIAQSHKAHVPQHFILRQSLSKQDRYKTSELLAIEKEILESEESLLSFEQQLFNELCEQIQAYFETIQQASDTIAEIDVLITFANTALANNYICPTIVEDNIIDIKEGRHPVIETFLPKGEFISNDVCLQEDRTSFIMLTGPNMSGKSTYLRQTALIVFLAQIGSFIPAQSATIGIRDKIFCRVGASDNLIRGESTFLVEMSETAFILQQATSRSLVIMDEIGRGTSVTDGESIAQAVVEYFLKQNIFTLFATHYHNLTDLQSKYMKNFTLSIVQQNDTIVFMRKIKEGAVKNSYGIEVAKLAGIPKEVLARARELLQIHEQFSTSIHTTQSSHNNDTTKEIAPSYSQNSDKVLLEKYQELVLQLLSVDINSITPIESQQLLEQLQTYANDIHNTQNSG